jgi:hypothetical protein
MAARVTSTRTAVDPLTGRTGAIIHPSGGLNKRDNNNFNPRVGLAWHPLERWVFRGGFGFYTVDNKFPITREQYDEYTATANQQANPWRSEPDLSDQQGYLLPLPSTSVRMAPASIAAQTTDPAAFHGGILTFATRMS